MQIRLSDDQVINIKENMIEKDIADVISETLDTAPLVKELARKTDFSAWEHQQDMDDKFAEELAEKYLENGEGAVHDYLFEQECDETAEEYLESNPSYGKEEIKKDILDFVKPITGAFANLDEDILVEDLYDDLEEKIFEAMYDRDDSDYKDIIPSHQTVDLTFIPDNNIYAFDDMYANHYDVVFSAETVIPDSKFIRILKFFNIAPSEFINEMKVRGIDLVHPYIPEETTDYRRSQIEEAALLWRAVLDVENDNIFNGNIGKLPLRNKYEIAEWNRTVALIRTVKDYDRPASLSMDELITTLDNASYGGVPMHYIRVPLKDVLSGKLDQPFITTNGGMTGVHDFINGSGYVNSPSGPILIDPSKGELRAKMPGYGIDSTYGIVGSYYKADIEPYTVSEYQRVKPNKWVHSIENDDGVRLVMVSCSAADGNDTAYMVRTFDEDHEPAGPLKDGDIYGSLEEAKSVGLEVIKTTWDTVAAPRF